MRLEFKFIGDKIIIVFFSSPWTSSHFSASTIILYAVLSLPQLILERDKEIKVRKNGGSVVLSCMGSFRW